MQCRLRCKGYTTVGLKSVSKPQLGSQKQKVDAPIDFLRASLCSNAAFLSRARLSFSSCSLAAAISSRIVEALKVSNGFVWSSGLAGDFWAGVSKSIKSPSWVELLVLSCSLAPRDGVFLRVSSKVGMFRTGETGAVGLRIDFKGTTAEDYTEMSIIGFTEAALYRGFK